MLEAFNSPVHIASVTLAVRDIALVGDFYARVLGLRRVNASDVQAQYAAIDGTVLLTLHARPDLPAAGRHQPGLFHIAWLLPSRAHLAHWVRHAQGLGVGLDGASDHLVSEAIYLSDPEGNGIEVYCDRPRSVWGRNGDGVAMATHPLDGASLLAEPSLDAPWQFPPGAGIGHVHLKVGDLAAAERFYRQDLGMSVMVRYPGAVFLSWGGYHHHIAVNIWSSRGAPPLSGERLGLVAVGLGGETISLASAVDPAGNRIIVPLTA